ncbi:YtxH domain-containing protein [Mucilaginibacter myungsuensis]|uniref:YtxH domain-containing protein n=1 Tax=Mucilaginibacter myungsuensis TaxID=649104 RepID=A0A929KZW6_9SPHI|nr:YtxH domain-containing protein [Mucilaginibacter myungsuensis]MBE9663640.1 YtxH domain-containing protein [Mucilaginibacter myungsuensis]MDN3599036.1 YtxH domain-containing protein [Mucilaginibacter myungsuensis]
MKDQTKLIAALLVGAAAGAAISLLITSDKGTELRGEVSDYLVDLYEKSRDKAQRAAEDARRYSNNVVEQARSQYDNIAGNVSDYKDQVRSVINDYTDQGHEAIAAAKAKVKATASELNGSIQNS